MLLFIGKTLLAFGVLFDDDVAVLIFDLIEEIDSALNFLGGRVSLLNAARELEWAPRIKAGATVDTHKDCLPHAADAIDILAVPLVFAAVGHKTKHLVLRLQHVGEYACHILVDLGVINARGDTN